MIHSLVDALTAVTIGLRTVTAAITFTVALHRALRYSRRSRDRLLEISRNGLLVGAIASREPATSLPPALFVVAAATAVLRLLADCGTQDYDRERHRMITISTNQNIVTMINVISVRPENQLRLVELMTSVGESLKTEIPGLISVSLHQSVDGTRVVNYQQWESLQAFENLQHKYAEQMRPLLDLADPDPHIYQVVYVHSTD